MPQYMGFLEAQGFRHMFKEEPYEDHHLLDGLPSGSSFRVDIEAEGFSVARRPRGGAHPGEWHVLATALTPDAMMNLVRAELTAIGLEVI